MIEMRDALKLEMHLALLCSFSNQTHQPRGKMADQQQYFKTLARA